MIGVTANFVYEIQNSVAMATSLVNFRKHLKLAISMPPVDAKNIEYVVHTTGIMTNFLEL